MKRERRCKILATLGPASDTREKIEALHLAGADAFRINMSHADHATLRRLVDEIREVERSVGHPIGVLVDIQGPKLRLGRFEGTEVALERGQDFTLDDSDAPGDASRVHLPHPEILQALQPGHRILLDDGRVQLDVVEADASSAKTRVESGRKLSDRKGVSLPDTMIGSSALTPKDRSDLDAALSCDIDWLALSFIQRPEDVAEVRKIARGKAAIMSKIEKPQALERIDEIIELSDAIMIARGDLGVEMPLELLPGTQKRLTRLARWAGKPVVVATQMLESMISAPVPTRAEVSDVATAVFEGADAVMLSAESASGDYPVEAVATMDRIAAAVERDANYARILYAQRAEPEATGADALSAATRQIAETLNLAAIITFTSSGATALRTARERPEVPIVALSPVVKTARRLALVWGTHCVVTRDIDNIDDMVDDACSIAYREGHAQPGSRVVITAGVPFGTPGATNLLRLAFVGSDGVGGI